MFNMSQPVSKLVYPGSRIAPARPRLEALVKAACAPQGFWWMSGIEGSTIPHIEADQFEWIQHYRFWNEDLTMMRQELTANWVRLVFPWYKINPAPGQYDWGWIDRVVNRAAELGFQIVLDPIHFGTPLWLTAGFGEPDFPQYAAEYFEQVARRYGAIEAVTAFVPHNEPAISAMFGGLLGEWPPYHKSRAEHNKLLTNIAKGVVLAVQAVSAEVAEPIFLHIEALDQAATKQPEASLELLEEIALINERRFLGYDLISGRVASTHRLTEELLASGVSEADLSWLQHNGRELDILGLDFYSYSEAWLKQNVQGQFEQERDGHGPTTVRLYAEGLDSSRVNLAASRPAGLFQLIEAYYARYQRPIVLTETDYLGSVDERAAWLGYTIEEVARLRQSGVPVLGYTWWGATDHLNWGMALKERNTIHPVGLWSLVPEADGTLKRIRTSLVDRFRGYTETATTSIGAVELSSSLP